VWSKTHPDEFYDVELKTKEEGGPQCPCKGSEVRNWCSHIDTAILLATRMAYSSNALTKENAGSESTPGAFGLGFMT
jgi:hypothetical protein